MRRTNVYVTDKQLERLRIRAEREGVYPQLKPQTSNGTLIPPLERRGFSRARLYNTKEYHKHTVVFN